MPRAAKAKKSAASAASHGDAEAEELPPVDPGWVDIEALPSPAERYLYFKPPHAFRDAMLNDRKTWAPGCQPHVVLAITNAVANICMPWWMEWSKWRRHASDFFSRLCRHRARIHEEHHRHREELSRRVDTLEERLDELERVVQRMATRQAAATPAFSPSPPVDRELVARPRGRSPFHGEPIEEAVLRAQMLAAAARSPSPSGFIRQLSADR